MLDLALPWPPRWTASGASGWRPRGDGLGVKEGENRSSPRGALQVSSERQEMDPSDVETV